MTESDIERSLLWNSLVNSGEFIPTDLEFCETTVLKQLEQFEDNWVLYNQYPNTLVNNRWGLPITNNNGFVSSTQYLENWNQYRKSQNKKSTNFQDIYADESQFSVPTEVYYAIPDIAKIVDEFRPDIGRVHFLKVGCGGYFPPHRDFSGSSPEFIRLLAVFGKCEPKHYGHILNGQLRYPLPGRFYFINFQLEHSMFSFVDYVYAIMLTIKLNQRTHDTILKHIGR